MPKLPTTILCACGEHFVASYLSGMGLVVALTRRGVPATDLIVTSEMGGRSISLQIKTGGIYSHVTSKKKPENNAWVWRIGSKAAEFANDSHWYAFVFVGDWPSGDTIPEILFVPSKAVAKVSHNPAIQEGWFWMLEAEAEQYRGRKGYALLKKALVKKGR